MRAQVSVETLITIGIITFVFIIMLISVAQKNYQSNYYKDLFARQNICNQLALAMSLSFAEGKKNFVLFELDKNASVSQHSITISGDENYFCSFIGTAMPKELNKGTIKIKNERGVVELEQIA